ncbi:hypothetical protein BDR26DRAFT_913899 [Obelidium mucronatum]|nr:hypothetical protein BDR26DRAFT_913899 [Obelidium mucronatum]
MVDTTTTNNNTTTTTQASFAAAFETFIASEEVAEILEAFAAAIAAACLPADQPYSYKLFSSHVTPLVSYKRKSLLGVFDCKVRASAMNHNEDSGGDGSHGVAGKRVVISGAGPVGLRAAVEAALVGFQVVVVELRSEFSRHNVIKTWNSTIADLQALGLSHFYPAFSGHGGGTLHLGIREMQTLLLKAALLLGAGVAYERGVVAVADSGVAWAVRAPPAAEARAALKLRAAACDAVALQPGEQDAARLAKRSAVDFFEPAASNDGAVERAAPLPAHAIPFEYLLVAEGESSRLIRHLGFDRKVWKFANMIGIVVNIDITPAALKSPSSLERTLPEFVVTRMAAKWKEGPLGKLSDLGFELENLEYLRSMKTHFFVCTIKKQTLKSCGIVKQEKDTIKELLDYSNLDIPQLEVFARELGNLAGVPQSCPLSKKHGVQIFDFSCKGQCVETIRKLESTVDETRPPALVLPVGDALQNPYWPQGLGINRGFHSALDAVHAIYVHATTQNYDLAVYERMTAFRAMEWYPLTESCLETPIPTNPTVKAATGNSREHNWTIDPLTRYSKMVFKSIHRNDIDVQAPAPSLPERYRRFHGFEWNTGSVGENKKEKLEDSVLYPPDDVSALISRLSVVGIGASESVEKKPATPHRVLSSNKF